MYFRRKRKSVPHVEENRETGSRTREKRAANRKPAREKKIAKRELCIEKKIERRE